MAGALAGCANSSFDTSGSWFSKPLDVFGRNAGYTYSQLDATKQERPITANDFVDANGACPSAAAPDSLGGGIAIGMSECDVVARVGPPSAVNLGRSPDGDRTAILAYQSGVRPGVYRFIAGRLKEMDRAEVPPPPEPVKNEPVKKKTEKKVAKKPPAKSEKPPKTDNKT